MTRVFDPEEIQDIFNNNISEIIAMYECDMPPEGIALSLGISIEEVMGVIAFLEEE